MFEDAIKTALDGDDESLSRSDILKNIDTSMYSLDELKEQEQIVEAILFMMGDSVTVDTLATALSKDHDIALAAVERLIQKYETEYKDRGMKVIRINHKYQMVANNKYFQNLVLVASKPQKPVLTDAVLETLSIIAYKQPITKPEIEEIRGVKSDFAVNRLVEYGLVEERGRLEAPGRPIVLGTTEEFLLRFGLESTDDLPILPPTREAEIQTEVEKELTETLGEPVHVDNDDNDNDGSGDSASNDSDNVDKDSVNNAINGIDNDEDIDMKKSEVEDKDNEKETDKIDIKETGDEELELEMEEDEEVTDDNDFNEVDKNLVDRYDDNSSDNNVDDTPYVDNIYDDIKNSSSTVTHERKDMQHDEKTGESEDKEPQ